MTGQQGASADQRLDWRDWAPEGALALVVLAAAVVLAGQDSPYDDLGPTLLVGVATAVAVLLCRRAPGAALALVWVTFGLQVVNGVSFTLVQAAVAAVAFGCARWGTPVVAALAGASIPGVGLVGLLLVTQGSLTSFSRLDVARFYPILASTGSLLLATAVTALLLLAVPWLAGLVLRATARARRSQVSQVEAETVAAQAQVETQQAVEIARLRADQTRLANDVHDVVGHSLAVILAQAESAQYLPDDDPARLKATFATIATSARSSLQDVRAVLGDARAQTGGAARSDGLAALVDGVRSAGREVEVTEVGTPRPLPPELEAVAHRVAQEMLTNAVRHGRRDAPVLLERHWPSGGFERDLRIEVANQVVAEVVADETQPLRAGAGQVDPTAGRGLPGMRDRLDAVGGRLDVRRREDTFTATAWLPVSRR